MELPLRKKARLSSIAGISVALAAVFSIAIISSTTEATARHDNPREIAGTGVGTIVVNNDTLEDVTIEFSASSGTNGMKVVDGAFIMTKADGDIVGSGTIDGGKIKENDFKLRGELGANGILGVNGGKNFKLTGEIGEDVIVELDSRLPGGGCRGSFVATVQPMDAEPT